MKNAKIRKTLLVAIGGLFVWWASKSPAQDTSSANASLQMPYAVTQVLQLEQAKIADATIIAYINSSGTSYNLNAAQIVFLRQQGVSDAVITAMLTQARTVAPAAPIQPATPMPQPQPMGATYATSDAGVTDPAFIAQPQGDPTVIAQPQVTYVQTAPTPYYCSYPSYPSYVYVGWPRVWWPFCWTWYGGGWHWGWRGGWGGGWHGGSVAWHGGGGWHGSWGGGSHGSWGGGWHGGGGHGSWGGGGHGGGGHR